MPLSLYCVVCKKKTEPTAPEPFVMKNGKSALRGTCPTCGRKVVGIAPKNS